MLILPCSLSAVEPSWFVSPPALTAGPKGAFDETAVKDPTIVFFEDKWHLFYTARGQNHYHIGYVAAPTLETLPNAPRTPLKQLRGQSDLYAAAPQVFFFKPRKTWYLIYQTRDSNYQPVYSTTKTIAKPDSWTKPKTLVKKDEKAKWIDFWIICDETTAYFFYTRSHRDVYVQSTSLKDFPNGFGNPRKVFSGIHEAVHIYKVKDKPEYHMLYELNIKGERSFGLAAAKHLPGPWKKITDQYAAGAQLKYPPNATVWTEEVSHGEFIRTGCDQRLEYNPEQVKFLIQGLRKKQHQGPYTQLPWKLGIIEKHK
jgi:hypothetical protein